ncbi:MAG: tRNA glutamyl-Q(34) synthetase GluQRS [Synechococcus sp. cluster3_bin.96]|nr:tRNA glutamyl-Q(34) synthetase GluQRS [Synechococcus sp. cluster3_bin.96]MDG2215885.1 tRNA glutamyl-Q(34) synthetase GluQRS [Synechococcus sp. cluster2_bin.235]
MQLPDHLSQVLQNGQRLRQQGYRGRFAPTPSGPLHLGNVRTALLSWLRARLSNGQWLLRVDDLDTPRIRPGAIESVLQDLRWLGLNWDGPLVLQSRRRGLYGSFLSTFRRQGYLYPCRCSRRELGGATIYPGTCSRLDQDWGLRDARLPAWRLRVAEPFDTVVGDVVLRRADGVIAYHLATSIDELALGINEVVRGQDLVSVCAAQRAVITSLGMASPRYGHVPLLFDASGQKLSKRDHATGLSSLRDRGEVAAQVIGQLAATLGLVSPACAISAEELLEELRVREDKLTSFIGGTDSSGKVRDYS